ncbi:hypothetical protein NH340_JMT00655 [Sarcoptes scabiei]|nr:hypothetical protein NH340_JMT00655 [Sarcoptes scabiei]
MDVYRNRYESFQQVAVGAVRREITFCQKVGIEIFGLVENMSGFKCQHCSHYSKVFATGGGKSLAEHAQIEFLFSLPIESNLSKCADNGIDFIEKYPNSETSKAMETLANNICKKLNLRNEIFSTISSK